VTWDWDDLSFWNTGEWEAIQEKYDEAQESGIVFCPPRDKLFVSLRDLAPEHVKAVIVGQDPYANLAYATGLAFAVPTNVGKFPPTLQNIFTEYMNDLHYPAPTSGDLTPWAEQGVLLWNAIPSVRAGYPLSHQWWGWDLLTREIIERLSPRVFVFLGGTARQFTQFVSGDSRIIETSHPSPRGSFAGRVPFLGSRVFSRINSALVELKLQPIEWRLQ